jgi:hypothetical protein
MKNTIILKSLAIGGYRSFGTIQRLPVFSKVNLFIGQNNSGKSNLLRFVHEIYPGFKLNRQPEFKQLDRHLAISKPIVFGSCINISGLSEHFKSSPINDSDIKNLTKVFSKKAELDNTEDAWFDYGERGCLEKIL